MTTTAAFLAELHALRAEWEALLAQVPPHRRHEPGIAGDWSAAGLVHHITWYEQEMVRLLITLSLDSSPLWALPSDARNAAIDALGQERPYTELHQISTITHRALAAAVAALPEEMLHDPRAFAHMPADWDPLHILAENSTNHYRAHLPALRAWVETAV